MYGVNKYILYAGEQVAVADVVFSSHSTGETSLVPLRSSPLPVPSPVDMFFIARHKMPPSQLECAVTNVALVADPPVSG